MVGFNMNDFELLLYFRIQKADLYQCIFAVSWSAGNCATRQYNYSTSLELTTLIILRRLSFLCRWIHITATFRKQFF